MMCGIRGFNECGVTWLSRSCGDFVEVVGSDFANPRKHTKLLSDRHLSTYRLFWMCYKLLESTSC